MTESAPSVFETIELAEQMDDEPACDIDPCDEPATHRFVHIPCGWAGVLLCKEHAEMVVKFKWAIGVIMTVLLGRCKGCKQHIVGSKTYKVVPLKP